MGKHILAAVGVVVVFVVVGAFVGWLVFPHGGPPLTSERSESQGPGATARGGEGAVGLAELRYLPDRPRELVSIRVAQLRGSSVFQVIAAAKPDAAGRAIGHATGAFPGGLDPNDLERVTTEGLPPWASGDGVVVFTTRRDVTADEILGRLPADAPRQREEVGAHVVYGSARSCWCVAEPRVVVTGRPDQVKPLLKRGGPPILDEDVRAALALANFGNSHVTVNGVAESTPEGRFPNAGPWSSFDPAAVLPQPSGDVIVLEVNWDAAITARSVLLTRDATRLELARRETDAFVTRRARGAAFPELKAILEGVRVKQEGDRLVATGEVSAAQVSVLARQGLMWQ